MKNKKISPLLALVIIFVFTAAILSITKLVTFYEYHGSGFAGRGVASLGGCIDTCQGASIPVWQKSEKVGELEFETVYFACLGRYSNTCSR